MSQLPTALLRQTQQNNQRIIQRSQQKPKRKPQQGQQRPQQTQGQPQAPQQQARPQTPQTPARPQQQAPQLPQALMRPPQAPAMDPGDVVPHPVLGPGGRNQTETMNEFRARQQAISARNLQRGDANRARADASRQIRATGHATPAPMDNPLPMDLQRQQVDTRNAQQMGAATAQATREQGRGRFLEGVGAAQTPGAMAQSARFGAQGDIGAAREEAQGRVGVSANELQGTQAIAGAQRFAAQQATLPDRLGFQTFRQQLEGGGTPSFLPQALRPVPQAAPPEPLILDQNQIAVDDSGRTIASNPAPQQPQQQMDPRVVEPLLASLFKQREEAFRGINDNAAIAAIDQQINQIIQSQMGGGVPQPQGNVGGATQAQPMPANATPQSLENGVIYQTRLGPARWDALAGRFVSLED